MSDREEKFEKMLDFVMKKYTDAVEKNGQAESGGQNKNCHLPSAYGG